MNRANHKLQVSENPGMYRSGYLKQYLIEVYRIFSASGKLSEKIRDS